MNDRLSTPSAVMQREFLWALWKLEVLKWAEQGPVVGLRVLQELRKRGHDVSPGALYPLFARMVEYGWLACPDDPARHARARKEYRITDLGRAVLADMRAEVARLHAVLQHP